MSRKPTLFSLSIDVEPDWFFPKPGVERPWSGFERAWPVISKLREQLGADGRRARFNWFVRADPCMAVVHGDAAWAFSHYRYLLGEAREVGDALGVHVHDLRWVESERQWLNDRGDAAWMEHCTITGLEAYRRGLGSDCHLFRFGDRWLSSAAVSILDRSGVDFDATLEPDQPSTLTFFAGHPATGEIPGTFGAPREPYRPDPDDPFRPAACARAGIWMVPLSVAELPERWAPVQRLPWRLLSRMPRYPRRARTLTLDREPRWFQAQVRQLYVRSRFLRCVVRTDAFIGPRWTYIDANLAWLRAREEIEFVSHPEAMSRLGLLTHDE